MIESNWPPRIASLRLDPQLPCFVVNCENLAELAWLDPDEDLPGTWHLTPICERCARAGQGRQGRQDNWRNN